MKIVFITLFKEGFGGGEGRVAHEIARHFSSHHDVVLICPGEKTGLYELPGSLEVFGVQSAGQGDMVITTITNSFGDFDFDGLERNATYALKVEAQGYAPKSFEGIHIQDDLCLKDIYLQKKGL